MALYSELSSELTKRTPSDCFFGDFSHWDVYDRILVKWSIYYLEIRFFFTLMNSNRNIYYFGVFIAWYLMISFNYKWFCDCIAYCSPPWWCSTEDQVESPFSHQRKDRQTSYSRIERWTDRGPSWSLYSGCGTEKRMVSRLLESSTLYQLHQQKLVRKIVFKNCCRRKDIIYTQIFSYTFKSWLRLQFFSLK